jgi:hypothetical protein
MEAFEKGAATRNSSGLGDGRSLKKQKRILI